MNSKIIIGAGRQAAETFYLLEDIGISNEVEAFAVDAPAQDQQLAGKKVIAISQLMEQYEKSADKPAVLIAVGNIKDNKKLALQFRNAGFLFFNAIGKSIITERQLRMGEGVTIAAGTVLTCNIAVGNHVIINIGCTISHDCVIGNYVNISPGCHLAGKVIIEDEVFIGTGASFIPQVTVGKGSIVAAGACVTKDVPPYTMVAGVPATIKKHLS